MSSFIINVTDTSGIKGTLVPDKGFSYSDILNDVNGCNLKFDSLGEVRKALIEMGAIVEIYRNGTLEFKGLIDKLEDLEGGGTVAPGSGFEIRTAQENGAYANSPYTSTASATIATEIINESSYFTPGTVETGLNIDFRLSLSDSLYNGLSNLNKRTGQDIQFDYTNSEIDILDHRGSSTSVSTLNLGIDMTNLRKSTGYPLGNDVAVYGKGDGVNQIKSNRSTAGQDATSKSTYGTIVYPVIDRSVISQSEADALADAIFPLVKDPTVIYDFEVTNPNQSITTGDVITLNARSQRVLNQEVRVVQVKRGVGSAGNEVLSIQAANTGYSKPIKTRNALLARLEKNQRDTDTYMMGSGNTLTWDIGINASSTAPLRLDFQVPAAWITDEAGNIRVNSMTLDYDVDEFRRDVGTASETNKHPDFDGSSAVDSHKHDPYDDGHLHSDPQQTSSAYTDVSLMSQDSVSNVTLTVGWNANQLYVDKIIGTVGMLWAEVVLDCDDTHADIDVGVFIHLNGGELVRLVWMHMDTNIHNNLIHATFPLPILASTAHGIYVDFYTSIQAAFDMNLNLYSSPVDHTHTVSTHNVNTDNAALLSSNKTPGMTGLTVDHKHDVSIGDSVSDAGSTNASEIDIYLDHWNGSSWINKHSIANTGKTLDTDVDITNSGTYPDAAGYWRVRIDTDSASPDYVQAIVKIKHALDS